MKRGVFNRTKVTQRGSKNHVCKFHDRGGQTEISQRSEERRVATSLVEKKFKRSTPRSTWAGGDIAKSVIGEFSRGTCTPPRNFVRLKTTRFIVKFRDTAIFMFYICCNRDAI
ncbi:predicted protein [Lichtheimia corymbifera JMRC:FSU:9682]|uniref:Uncharacterized protein n=1 Tax=Lichtheimia corymbifera JMRC:FSU:9682 TaxID=1263082 RepID=A0A068S4Q1_9FUNG|nr:predicted protein [Lichtheimia corymbifera JMRC:FSU:9682]